MFCHQQGKIRIICLLRRILIAMAVNGNNTIRIFIYDFTFGIHAEGSYQIFIL